MKYIMNKELRMVEGIPAITNEVMKFDGMPFALTPFNGPMVSIVIKNGFADSCPASTVANEKMWQYDKHNGYVTTSFSHDDIHYMMLICMVDNKVYIYKSSNYQVGAAFTGIGIKMMEAPVEKIFTLYQYSRALESALSTIHAMTDMDNDDACRLLHREYLKFSQTPGTVQMVMKVFQTSEFIAEIGAKCWMTRKNYEYADNKTNGELVKLPDEGISSSDALDESYMSCIGTDGDYLLLSSCTGADAVWLRGTAAFIKIGDNFTYTGEPNNNLPVKSKVTLKNAALRRSLQMDENPTVYIEGACSIAVEHFDSCIKCSGEVTITGQGTLTLFCKSRSAAIGHGGISQSYGRYVPNHSVDSVTKIIVDGVHLEVNSGTPNFSIGSYGCDNNVEIVLRNGGTVNGVPEAIGKVKLESVGTTYAGSTKIEGSAVYSIEQLPDDISGCKINADPYAAPDKKFMN